MIKMMLIAGAGGFVGTCGRYLVGKWSGAMFHGSFPMGTFLVNVITRVRDKNFMIFNQAKDIEYWAAFQGRLIYLYSLVLLIPEDKLPV